MNLSSIFEEISSTSRSSIKMNIMKNYEDHEDLKKALLYASDPFMPFFVSKVPKTKARSPKLLSERDSWKDFFSVLDMCAARHLTGNSAIDAINAVFSSVSDTNEKWMRKILKKHLAIGVSVKTINKVFPGLIPTFEVSLAQKFEIKRLVHVNKVFVEPKLDGIRCFTIVRNNRAIMLARSGKPISNFDDTILPEIIKMGDGCYDGELMGKDFLSLMRQAYRKENAITDGTYLALFDFLPLEEWDSKVSKMSCDARFKTLRKRLKNSNVNLNLVNSVERVTTSTKFSEIKSVHDHYVNQGFEGAMIKDCNASYKFGRGHEIMKLKAFHDVDLPIVGLIEGTGKHAGKLGSFQVEFNGVEVQVGSGLTDVLREQVWSNPDAFVNRVIEVRYQEVTPDGSLRFPTFVCFRNDR